MRNRDSEMEREGARDLNSGEWTGGRERVEKGGVGESERDMEREGKREGGRERERQRERWRDNRIGREEEKKTGGESEISKDGDR